MKAQRGSRGITTLSLTSAPYWGGRSTPRPGRFTPGMTQYPLYRRLVGPQDWSGQVQKVSLPLGFSPQPIQPKMAHKITYLKVLMQGVPQTTHRQ